MPYRKIPSVLLKNIVCFTEEFHPFYLIIPSVFTEKYNMFHEKVTYVWQKTILCLAEKSHPFHGMIVMVLR